MLLKEIITDMFEGLVWGKSGSKVVRKYRCSSGNRSGRTVASPQQCHAPIDVKARIRLKRTKARFGNRLTKKANKTKRINPASKRVRSLNKRKRK